MREDRNEQFTQELAIDVNVVVLLAIVFDSAQIHLQVSDHVADDEADANDSGDRHDVLFANGG